MSANYFQIFSNRIQLQSSGSPQFIDLTELLQEQVSTCNIHQGTLTVYSRHTTAVVVIQENEPLLLQDLCRILNRLAPPDGDYAHDNFDIRTENLTGEDAPNGHAHLQSLFLGQSVHVPIEEGQLGLGRWQRVFFLELDAPRSREVVIQIAGVNS